MSNKQTINPGQKWIAFYLATSGLLVVMYFLLSTSEWRSSGQFHTLVELAATATALFVGVMALVRYYSDKHTMYLFVGTGFIGTALLDGYHAIVTSAFFSEFLPSGLPSLIPWSWVASRFFLSLCLYLSWLAWRREQKLGENGRISETLIYSAATILTIASFLFFALFPLPRAYYPEIFFHRPEEFIPAALFALALLGYLSKENWRTDNFESWLILSLVVGFFSQALFMSRSGVLFDAMFDLAHVMKVLSYCLVLNGLLINTYATFRKAVETSKQLARANEDLEQFAYVASHDLKSPLRAIDNLAEWIVDDVGGSLPAASQKHLAQLRGRVRRMEALLDDLLEYSRTGRNVDDSQHIECESLVQDILDTLDVPIGFRVDVEGDTPTIQGRKSALRQVLMNLISNAIKHHDKPNGLVTVATVESNSVVEFTIDDDGPGIAPEFHERVFKPFQRLQSRDDVDGTGLGLAIVKRLVEKEGGSIQLRSSVGDGSHFRIAWPKQARNESVYT